jgi:uncharacterized membrane protein (UPF0127 family)
VTSPYLEQFRQLRDPAPPQFASLETARGLAVLRWVISIVLVFGLIGCVTKGANNPADPYLSSPAVAGRTPLDGFGETQISVKTAEKVLKRCLLLAQNAQQRQRGLMQVTDPTLGGYDGMLFRYDQDVDPTQEAFWMRNTPMALSIAYLSSDGHIVTAVDMQPCADSPDCPPYPAAGPYRFTIEVPQGNLPSLGIVEGSTVVDENVPCAT